MNILCANNNGHYCKKHDESLNHAKTGVVFNKTVSVATGADVIESVRYYLGVNKPKQASINKYYCNIKGPLKHICQASMPSAPQTNESIGTPIFDKTSENTVHLVGNSLHESETISKECEAEIYSTATLFANQMGGRVAEITNKDTCSSKEKCIKRMKEMRPVINNFLEEFVDNKKYDGLLHKFNTLRKSSCLLDAIATTLFGKKAVSEANKFTNDLRNYLEKEGVLSKHSLIDIEDDKIKKAINKYVIQNYGVDISIVVLVDFGSYRHVQEDEHSGHGAYKVPVRFYTNKKHATFYGISLDVS